MKQPDHAPGVERHLPEQWRQEPLRDLCKINPRLDRNARWRTESLVPYVSLQVPHLAGKHGEYEQVAWGEVKHAARKFHEGDILFSVNDFTRLHGVCFAAQNVPGGVGACSDDFVVLRPDEKRVRATWIWRFLSQRSVAARLDQMAGPAYQVDAAVLGDLLVPVPPTLAEQDRAALRLSGRLQDVGAAIDDALSVEFEATRLLSNYLELAFASAKRTAPGWTEAPLTALIAEEPQRGTSPRNSPVPAGVPLLRPRDLEAEAIAWNSLPCYAVAKQAQNKYGLREDDILLWAAGGRPRTRVVSREWPTVVYGHEFRRLRVKPGVAPAYLAWFLQSDAVRQLVSGSGYDAAALLNVPVFYPVAPQEQQRIVVYLDHWEVAVQPVHRDTRQMLDLLHDLRESMIHQTFRGGL